MMQAIPRKGQSAPYIRRFFGCLAFFLFTLLSCAPARAQTSAAPSNPTRDILDRVGASAAEIKEALGKDMASLLELKRWVAKNAADDGQVISDADLTDEAIFDRLRSDAEFRAVATQILNRSNRLSAKQNTDSETGPRPKFSSQAPLCSGGRAVQCDRRGTRKVLRILKYLFGALTCLRLFKISTSLIAHQSGKN